MPDRKPERRTLFLKVRLTPTEKTHLERLARRRGMTVADAVREAVFAWR